MNLKDFEKFIKEGESKRVIVYQNLCNILEKNNIEYTDMILILDWLNSQTILNIIGKDKWNCLRCADLLNGATKKLMKKMLETY
jgi:hypothetical protein